jgi:hypothetical protein
MGGRRKEFAMKKRIPTAILVAASLATAASAQRVHIPSGSVVDAVGKLEPGEYVWAPQIAPAGPTLLIVNLVAQRATLFRNGVPIAASTVSTGRPGHSTPTGVFTVLQKQVEHYSSKYNGASMPYMQRLTWYGVALHAGNLPGYPASHGCIRLPRAFAKLLYGISSLGMTVVITDQPTGPRIAPTPELAARPDVASEALPGSVEWQPELSPAGPVSIVVSIADGKAVVLRNGKVIGSAPVTVEGPVDGTFAYALKSIDAKGQNWVRVALAGDSSGEPISTAEFQRFRADPEFRRNVAAIVGPGTTVVVTPDSLKSGGVAQPLTLIEAESKPR